MSSLKQTKLFKALLWGDIEGYKTALTPVRMYDQLDYYNLRNELQRQVNQHIADIIAGWGPLDEQWKKLKIKSPPDVILREMAKLETRKLLPASLIKAVTAYYISANKLSYLELYMRPIEYNEFEYEDAQKTTDSYDFSDLLEAISF